MAERTRTDLEMFGGGFTESVIKYKEKLAEILRETVDADARAGGIMGEEMRAEEVVL